MKFLILLLISFQVFASSPKRSYTISDLSSTNVIEVANGYRKISILVGVQRKSFVLKSINNICLKKEVSCKIEDDEKIPLSKLTLEVKGKEDQIKNIEKMID